MNDTTRLVTTREKEVLHLLAEGLTYKKIATQLGVTSETVKKHLKNIYGKLEVTNKIEALRRFGTL